MSKHILITGATKGIGRACAEHLAASGWTITAVARTADDLVEMQHNWAKYFPNSTLHTVAADLGLPQGSEKVPLANYDVVLLNAAAFSPGKLLGDEDTFEHMLQLNVLGNHRLARRLLPAMVNRASGHLVVIGSTGTDNWKPHMTAYVATKYALRGLFLGWEQDLASSGVLATLVAPGATLTASWDNETPPPDILPAARVAAVVADAINQQITGRITVIR